VDHASLVDQSAAPLEVTIDALSAAGITEPSLLVRPPDALSEGQRHRALLAITLLRLSRGSPPGPGGVAARHRAASTTRPTRTTTLLIDEFTSTLDPVWAGAVARALPRLLTRLRTPIRVVVATSRPDLEIPGSTRLHLPDLAPSAA
jgi:ABC-type ATPase with predicted acetyltransferase domain